jgi:hypothetical protein
VAQAIPEWLDYRCSLRDDRELAGRPSEAGRLLVGQVPAMLPASFGFVSGFAAGGLRPLANQSFAALLFLEVIPET